MSAQRIESFVTPEEYLARERAADFKSEYYQQIESPEHNVIIHQDIARVEVYTRQADVDWVLHAEEGLDGAISLLAIGAEISLADLYEGVAMEAEAE